MQKILIEFCSVLFCSACSPGVDIPLDDNAALIPPSNYPEADIPGNTAECKAFKNPKPDKWGPACQAQVNDSAQQKSCQVAYHTLACQCRFQNNSLDWRSGCYMLKGRGGDCVKLCKEGICIGGSSTGICTKDG